MTMTAVSSSDRNQATAGGGWIPWVFVGLFCIVLAANGTMIAVAISSFTGMETTSAYKKGLSYNELLATAAEQEALGWAASLHAEAGDAGQVVMTFALEDREGAPIAAADIRARIDRPLQQGFDQIVTLDEFASGRYQATVDLPLKGQWDVRLTAVAHGHRYQLTERIQVTP